MSVIQQTVEVDIEAIKADHQEALTTVSASAVDLRAAANKKFMQKSVHVECPVATHAQNCSSLGDVGEQDIETLEADHREARKKYETALEAKKLAVEAQKGAAAGSDAVMEDPSTTTAAAAATAAQPAAAAVAVARSHPRRRLHDARDVMTSNSQNAGPLKNVFHASLF